VSKPLDELYLSWLFSQVSSRRPHHKSHRYWCLLRQLYTKEFIWIIPNDDNRLEDGRDLRYEFIGEQELDHVDQNWLTLGCSMLEMLIGLSRRLSFDDGGEPRDWFWILIENAELDRYDDVNYVRDEVDGILDTIIFRLYGHDGRGGLFPLRYPRNDQTEIELWYQASAYLIERE